MRNTIDAPIKTVIDWKAVATALKEGVVVKIPLQSNHESQRQKIYDAMKRRRLTVSTRVWYAPRGENYIDSGEEDCMLVSLRLVTTSPIAPGHK